MSEASDNTLIEASLTDARAFDEIFQRHRISIFRFVSRRVGQADAADLTAETFARAFEARHRFDILRPSVRSWLLGIASHVCIDHLRRSGLRRRRQDEVAAGWLYRSEDEADESAANVDARMFGPALAEALRALPETDRQALLLYAVTRLTYEEIAEVLAIPIGTVRSTLHRARRRMRELLPDDVRTLFEGEREEDQR